MANKLRDLFNEGEQEYTGKVSFANAEKYNEFVNIIDKVTKDGIPSTVEGISGISISLKDGNSQYPIEQSDNVTRVIIFPNEAVLTIDVETDKGQRKLRFLKKELQGKTELTNIDKKGAAIKIAYDRTEKKVSMNYNARFKEANSIEELVDNFNTLYYFVKKMFRNDVENEDVENILNYFLVNVIYFEQLLSLEKVLKIEITPSTINDIDDDDFFIERLYFSVIDNRILRSNRKVTSMNGIVFDGHERLGDNPLIVSFMDKGLFTICDKKVEIFIVSMAFNLIVDKEEIQEDGDCTLYFKDTEKSPMYISSKIYLNESDAQKELENCMNNKASYTEAKMLGDYIRERYETYKKQKSL